MPSNHIRFNRTALSFGAALTFFLMMSGCDNSQPSGQVIARVNGDDLTLPEFEHERGRMPEVPASGIDNAVVEAMVRRRALAQIAQQRGLEQDPQYHFELRRAREELLVGALYRRLANDARKSSDQDIVTYMAKHPWQFSERRILQLSGSGGGPASELTIDTADYAVRPPFPVMEISPGRSMLWQGRVYRVSQVREAPLEAKAGRAWALNRLTSAFAEQKASALYKQVLESGRLQYAPGYGPSGAQNR